MYSKIQTATLLGIASIPITVEVDLSPGLPSFDIVGNVTPQVKEGRERIRTALHNLGLTLPAKRTTINLSPAKIRKDTASFDVPIAVGIMCAMGLVDTKLIDQCLFLGELNLSGDVLSVNGVLPIVSDAMNRGVQTFVVPSVNVGEAQLVNGANIIGVSNLVELFELLTAGVIPKTMNRQVKDMGKTLPDFKDVNGQKLLRRAAEISAAGMHNFLLIGPPGAGKTMIAERMPSILPDLTKEEQLEISKIYSIKGLLKEENGLLVHRPFRNPHHTISKYGMTGGGANLLPGEISLAHTGVLFLDEMTEFDKETLEILRQPLEDKEIRITRQTGTAVYPSDFLLLGAMNPCNCGYYPNMQLCRCTPASRKRFYSKLSQPLIDRMDLFVHAESLSFKDITTKNENESSKTIRSRVNACQEIQLKRYKNESFCHNSQIPANRINEYCNLSKEDEKYMHRIFDDYNLTGRTYHKILRVARTIADLEKSEQILTNHLKEAVCYRNPDEFVMGED